MVQGISSSIVRSGAISQVAKREEPRSSPPPNSAISDRKASFEELLQVSVENRQAAEVRIEDVDAALQSAGDIGGKIARNRGDAMSAHSLTPERVASLLED
jgi:hypothetical protein